MHIFSCSLCSVFFFCVMWFHPYAPQNFLSFIAVQEDHKKNTEDKKKRIEQSKKSERTKRNKHEFQHIKEAS